MNAWVNYFCVVIATVLAGCAVLPPDQGYRETGELIRDRGNAAPLIIADEPSGTPAIPDSPMTVEDAKRLAFANSPRVRQAYARLGFGRAELEDARRIGNPTVGYAKLEPRGATGSQITRSLSLGLGDLLLLPARKRFAAGELERLQAFVADELLTLATDVETAWFELVSAGQVAAMRDVVARSAESSAELAQRFFDAGNINRLQLEQEYAAATKARIDALRANADAMRARGTLASLIGLPADASWTTHARLPEPPTSQSDTDALLSLALDQRLDLSAARQEVALREDALGVARRWRWLGSVEAGYEREREVDGGVIRGPSLSLELPIFNQGQGAISRAQAELLDARARLDGLLLAAHNDVRVGREQLALTRDIVDRYRTALLPRREAVVARTQEQVNFMLVGVFELILVKQQEYDAYQEYLEAVRDYWVARSGLRRSVGGRLPDDGGDIEATIGVEDMLPKAAPPGMDHSMHDMSSDGATGADPHAGHRMPKDGTDADTTATPSADAEPATHEHGDTP